MIQNLEVYLWNQKVGSLVTYKERFDRQEGKKIHIQTLAAMNPSSDCYEDLFDTACRIGVLPSELKQLFLLTVMNVLGGNVDDHNKNFSFLMSSDGV